MLIQKSTNSAKKNIQLNFTLISVYILCDKEYYYAILNNFNEATHICYNKQIYCFIIYYLAMIRFVS